MTADMLDKAINLVDEDLLLNVFQTPKKKKESGISYLTVAAVFALIVVSVAVLIKNIDNPLTDKAELTQATTGSFFGGIDQTNPISDSGIVFQGEAFTIDEILKYVENNKYNLVGAIACEYDNFNREYRLFTKGYYHVNLGEKNIIDLNTVTLPVCVGDEIVGEVTLVKNNGEISCSVATRSNCYPKLNKTLRENKGTDLAFFYVDNFTETLISESGSVYVIRGKTTVNLNENIDYYNKYKTEYNSFSYEMLINENNYISVIPYPEEKITSSQIPQPENNDISAIPSESDSAPNNKVTDITLEDILSQEILRVEWGNSYDLLAGNSNKPLDSKDKEHILNLLNTVDYSVNENYEQGFGALWHLKFIFADGDYATVIIAGESFFIETAEGLSKYYVDKTDNTVKIVYHLANLK